MIDTSLIDHLIVGRIEPYIYAFETNTVPNYLKVGDTYRPVSVRMDEWRKCYADLRHEEQWEWVAKTQNNKYFRDFAVHYYLENLRQCHRLMPEELPDGIYYSREFFQHATAEDVDAAIRDIEAYAAHIDGSRAYQFYSEERLPEKTTFERCENYLPRPNQQQTIDAFVKAREEGRRNLLMYAVMRFGKSFTAMCCATQMQAKTVLIVSAKADVRIEWQKTIESHERFADYVFLDSRSLLTEPRALSRLREEGKKAAIFITLQDLTGKEIKEKHADLFRHPIDLLIVDETHFGARADEYGRILREAKQLTAAQQKQERKIADEYTYDDLEQGLKQLKELTIDTRLHLSGTPYRILMGSEFAPQDIIAFYQFSDIMEDKEKYDAEHINEDNYNEWNNPYYGFPQMVRFAFQPSQSARRLMERLKVEGKSAQLNELFYPCSIKKDTTEERKHRSFVHRQEVLDLLHVIDGSAEDEQVLGFLNYDKLKEGKMCRHIVMVLPFCASCDAMEQLLHDHAASFLNLKEYTVLNISGLDNTFRTTESIKARIQNEEKAGHKTLTLTVNRMLTGSTIPQWDTMLFLKDVSSPQEYDQAIFRLQNQYIATFQDEDGHTIRYNMKPQTLLVDFDPNRMFYMQEQKSKIYNVNTDARGNEQLEQRLRRELEISPIIVLNRDKLVQATPTNILNAVRNYSAHLTVMDEACDIPADTRLLDDAALWDIIKDLEPLDSKKGIQIKPVEDGEEQDYDMPLPESETKADHPQNSPSDATEAKDDEKREKRLATLFAQILFFALLTEDRVKSLQEVLEAIRRSADNQRIARNVGLRYAQMQYLYQHLSPFILSDLDYKINNTNELLRDETISPLARVESALQKFGRLSKSEIVTPSKVADEMVALLPDDAADNDARFLDIASKEGEFACALYKRFGKKVRKNIYAIPTSKTTYEFTRKVYCLLGMPKENVFSTFNAYDLLDKNNEMYINKLTNMSFKIVVGNPPYQLVNEGDGTGADPIYHFFINIGRRLSRQGIMIHPGRFLFNAGKTPKDWNQQMLNDKHYSVDKYWINSNDVFPSVDLKGGVAITNWDEQKEVTPIGFFTIYPQLKAVVEKVKKENFIPLSSIVYPRDLYHLSEQLYIENPRLIGRQSEGHKYDVGSSVFEVLPELFYETCPNDGKSYTQICGRIDNARGVKWIRTDFLRCPDNLNAYKVFVAKTNGTGMLGEPLSFPIIGRPNMGHTVTFLSIGNFEEESQASALLKYIQTKFARTLLGTLKVTQDNPKETWNNIPLQDFTVQSDIDWSKDIADIDRQLYRKYNLSQEEINFIESMIKPMN